jgi:hypothetical protein
VDTAWLRRVVWALAAALAAGALVFLAARGVGALALFAQHQQLLREVAGTLGGGIEGLATGELRAVRLQLQRLDAEYERLSLLAGAAAAALAAVATYLRLEGYSNGRRAVHR